MNQYLIEEKYNGKIVKDFLRQELKLSTKLIVSLKQKSAGIMLNDAGITVCAELHTGDILSLDLSDNVYSGNFPENAALLPLLDIIYEDGSLLILNKPPYMPVHPSRDHYTDTLANALLAYFNRKNEIFNFRAVNRLDRNTSGLLVVAKNKFAAYKLGEQIKNRRIKKFYTAFLHGDISKENTGGMICRPIKREQEYKIKRICTDDGEYALTEYKIINVYNNISEVEASPVTGRTHQLRVHFSTLGYPVIGDDLYGGHKTADICRQALHSSKLELTHPETNEFMTFACGLPADLINVKNYKGNK